MVPVAGAYFDRRMTSEHPFPKEVQATRTYCGRMLFSPQLGRFEFARLCEL